MPPSIMVSSFGSPITAEVFSTICTLVVSTVETARTRETHEMAENTMDMFLVKAGNGVVLADGAEILGYLHQPLGVGLECLEKLGWRTADGG